MASLYDRISKGTISVDEITASMERSTSAGGKYFQSMEKQSKTLNGQISTLKDNFSQFAGVLAEDTTNAISSEFLPAINNMIQSMQEGFSEEGFAGMAEAFAEGFTNILMMLVEKAPEVANVALTMIQTFITAIQENLPTITNSAITIILTLVQGILTMLPQILQMGIQLIIQLGLGIAEQIPQLVPQIVDCILLIAETLIDNLDQIMEAGYEIIFALIEGIFNSLPNLIAKLPELILKLCQALLKLIFVQIPEIGKNLITTLISSIFNFWNNMITKIREFFKGTIIDTLLGKVQDIANVGKNLVQGLWNGMLNAKDWLLNKVKSFAKSIIEKIKKTLGIASPSKVMRDEVGKFMPQGIEVGFEKELPKVYDDMQRAIDLETEKMNASVKTGNVYNRIMNTTPVQVNGSYTSRLEVDGEVLAEVVNDVNDKKDLQYQF